ncbi:ribonuclease domain-containing protein [Actinomadura viridis]|uniref:ribonuclease domain-containing protein n=1 Tax=Actinomadura viridis TaxID=58110 RepID=UPI0036CBFDA6
MKSPRSHHIVRFLLLVPLLVAGLTAPATAQAAAPAFTGPAATAPAAPVAAAIPPICESQLPPEAGDTIALIEQGGPYPYPQDGTVFQNREGLLPDEPSGYYHEYTVKTPGVDHRGARRIVTAGDQGADAMYYTADHYESFSDIDFTC